MATISSENTFFNSPQNTAPAFLKQKMQPLRENERVLVVIQLNGGNDGLNTIVPFQDDLYYKNRPNLSLAKKELIALDTYNALHPALSNLQKYYHEGELSVIHSVGYPNPNRSHFRSMDIYHSAAPQSYENTGWVGRYIDNFCMPEPIPTAIEMSNVPSLVMKGNEQNGISFEDPRLLEKFFESPASQNLLQKAERFDHLDNQNLAFLYKTLNVGAESGNYINEKLNAKKLACPFPSTELGKDLKTIAEMMASGLETKIYYTSLGSFDTHALQLNTHQKLLQQFAEGVDAFIQCLKKQALWGKTSILVFSEFGRRVAENAGKGTDHGVGNFMLVFSKHLAKAGFYNAQPSLQNLLGGDLMWKIDFRQVYTAILEDWLGVSSEKIIVPAVGKIPLFAGKQVV
ncbi:MAG: DUF1501 domain-containing protein [Chitinophagales bacterium]|nr:DUF1501 domain-containing protein [Bacteroidota bacterium]MCB9043608.1 DUF1501 domain-containing protein [Chitinophagales bacterium]